MKYHLQGTGTPVLLIHGYPFNSLVWNRTCDPLAKNGWQVIVPDLSGFRQSPLTDDRKVTTMEHFADELFALLQQIGITQKIVIVGLSMGGYIAMQFAQKHADFLAGMVLCGTKTVADSPQIAENRRKQAVGLLDGSLSLADIADAMIPKLFAATTREQKPELLAELRNIIIESQHVRGVAAAALGMAERSDTTEILKQLEVPILFVCGSEDQFSPPSEMRQLSEWAQRGTFIEIPVSGHLPPMEQPERFAGVFEKFR